MDDASELAPLAKGGASPVERRLLRAARGDAATFAGRRRIMAGLGFGGLWSLATLGAALKASAAQSGTAIALASGAVAVGAAALWVAVPASPSPVPHEAVTAHTSSPTRPEAHRSVEKPSAERSDSEPTPTDVTSLPPAAKAAARTPDALSLELDAVEQAREAFARGAYTEALDLLDAYRRRFTHRRLDTEAMVLRIETLAASGDHASAERLGRRFLAKHADGPYARRVRSLIGERTEP